MIIDSLDRHFAYKSLGSRIARGFEWFTQFSPDTSDGRYDIDKSDIYALVQSYDTASSAEKKYESHRDYLDIQYVAAGCEIIYYAPLGALSPVTEYYPDKDYQLYADPAATTPLQLSPGMFALFFPQDGHKPGCVSGSITRVKKVVIKVRI